MIKNSFLLFFILNMIACQSTPPQDKKVEKMVQFKKPTIMEEYRAMKAKLESQGYVITTDSISKVFIDNAVTINYDKKSKKSK
jgi:hypothetical protein